MLNLGAVWGIDVGDSALKAVKLKRVGKAVALLDFRVIRYSEIGGEPGARREGMLPQALDVLQQAGLGRDRCIVSIAPQMVFNRFINLPPVDKRRIPEIVLYEAKQQIPFNLNEVVWAYEPVKKDFVLGEEIAIGLFAAKRDVIDAYLAELAPIQKRLYGVQVSQLALFNFIRHEIAVEKPTVVIDVGAQSTNLLVLDGQHFWPRNLPIGGNSFTTMLEKRLNIPRAEAEKLKYTVADSRHRRRLLEVLRPVMRDLVAEIQRSVGYYKSISQAVKFEEILVTGEGYKLFGLDRFLAEQLQYQITPIHQLKNIVYQGAPERLKELEQNLPSLGVAVGLGLQGLGVARSTINLLPESFIVHRELRSKRFSGLIAAAIVWAIVGSLYLSANQTVRDIAQYLNIGQDTLTKVNQLQNELTTADRGLNPTREATFKDFGRHREFYPRLLGAVSAVIPREVQIDNFKWNEPSAALPGGGPGGMRGQGPGPSAGGPAAPSPGAALVGQAKITLSFTVTWDATKQATWGQKDLPEALSLAVIYPEKIPALKMDDRGNAAVAIGDVKLITSQENAATYVSAPGGPTATDKMTATVTLGLITPDEADKLKVELPAKRAKEAEERAAAERSAAAPSAAPAPARTAAPPATRRR